jgi:hypothetical protein
MPLAHDLPDLDLLLGAERPSTLAAMPSAPVSTPAPVAPAASPVRKTGTYWLGLTDGRRVEAVDVLTVSRDLADGTLIVQVGSQAYGHVAEITDAESRRRLKAALKELAQQMTEPPRETPSATSVAVPQPAPAAPKSVMPPPVTPPRPSTPIPVGDDSWKLPNYNEMANEPLKLRGGAPKQAVPEINIASAIEAYLQHKVRHTPEFENRRLHISSAPHGGVRIEVDGRFYEAVSDIEDLATRSFIAEAIQEWQASQ